MEVTVDNAQRWDERALLLLGVLMTQRRHGYQINDFIERRLCQVVSMKKPTAYALLDRLAAAGHISVSIEQEGNRPPRKVYTVTGSGRALFGELLQRNLASLDAPTFAGDIGLMFLNHLPLPEAIACLRQRLARLDALLADSAAVPPHGGSLTLNLALDHVTTLRRADRAWLGATIARLEEELAEVTADEATATA
jgi:DNA-binding PadR family transcriptional regulator